LNRNIKQTRESNHVPSFVYFSENLKAEHLNFNLNSGIIIKWEHA
jgi:hypothetical protein